MFSREKKTARGTLLQLVESRRGADGKVRQQLAVSLGECRMSFARPWQLRLLNVWLDMTGFCRMIR